MGNTYIKRGELDIKNLMIHSKNKPCDYLTHLQDREVNLRAVSTDGCTIVESTTYIDKSIPPHSHASTTPFVEMNFMIEGCIIQSYENFFCRQMYSKGYHNILFGPGCTEINELNGSGNHRIFSVHILPERAASIFLDYLPNYKDIIDNIENSKKFVLHSLSPTMDRRIKQLLFTFWEYSPESSLAKLYYESRVLELLGFQLEAFSQGNISNRSTITKSELEALYFVKEFLQNNLDEPSLTKLSKKCGLSEVKLKNTFKQVFGQSVYKFVSEERLQKAKYHLMQGKSISNVAYEFGYAHPQHFHRAFKKRFGITPKSIQ